MKIKWSTKEEKLKIRYAKCHIPKHWFAWYPVRCMDGEASTSYWLTYVYKTEWRSDMTEEEQLRKYWDISNITEYLWHSTHYLKDPTI